MTKQPWRLSKMAVLWLLSWLFAIIFIWRVRSAAATDLPSLPPLAPDCVPSLKSQNSNTPTAENIINSSGDPVDIYWVHYVGGLVSYGHLAPAESYVEQTYVTHPWIIYDDRISSYIVGFLPIDTAAQAVIKRPSLNSSGVNPNIVAGSASSSGTSSGKTTATGQPTAAFDCTKAISPTEKRICADPSLAKMDQEMGTLYRSLIQNAKDVKAWKADQGAWLVERNRCKDDGCLRQEYQERLVILRSSEPHNQWKSHWSRVDASGNNGSELVITRVTGHSFEFDLNARAGANTGELEGKAILDTSSTAHYDGTAQSSTEGCSLVFKRVLNRLNIEQAGNDVNCGAGMGVYYSGTYVASGNNPSATPDLLSLGVVQTTAQDDTLRKLLGEDYDTMVKTADSMIDHDDNLDGNGATVVSMFVRGVACNTKSVLMFDAKGHQWAAVWEPVANLEGVVELRYYTNVTSDKNTLPKTISAQREVCPGETVRVRMMP